MSVTQSSRQKIEPIKNLAAGRWEQMERAVGQYQQTQASYRERENLQRSELLARLASRAGSVARRASRSWWLSGSSGGAAQRRTARRNNAHGRTEATRGVIASDPLAYARSALFGTAFRAWQRIASVWCLTSGPAWDLHRAVGPGYHQRASNVSRREGWTGPGCVAGGKTGRGDRGV